MNAQDIVKDTIRIATTAGLSKDVIDLLEKKVSLLADDNTSLRVENERLRKENEELRQVVNQKQTSAEYVEIEGLLWKRKSGGGYEGKPRCPLCSNHPVLFEFPPGERMHWHCSKCKGTFDYADPPSA